MPANRVTMKDVAREAGVTSAAVSYALSGKRPISEETRRRVEQAIKRLGYTPNMAARTLSSATRDSRLIGVVVPQTEAGSRLMFQNQFYSEILGSIELCARQKGYHVIISATDANESYLTLAKERNLDGIIVIGMYPDSFYQQMKKSQNFLLLPGKESQFVCLISITRCGETNLPKQEKLPPQLYFINNIMLMSNAKQYAN